MNNIENIALTTIEECAEVSQALSKCLRFGFSSYNPVEPKFNNIQEALNEYYQLEAMMELLLAETGLQDTYSKDTIEQIKNNKIEKFKSYQEVSKKLGYLE
jgi:hypothetical protein